MSRALRALVVVVRTAGETSGLFGSEFSSSAAIAARGPGAARGFAGILSFYLAVFAATYFAVIAAPFAFLDDYVTLANAMRHDTATKTLTTFVYGRPLSGLLDQWSMSLMRTVGDFRYLRCVEILGTALLAATFHLWLVGARFPRAVAVGLPLMIGLMPAFQTYAAWAATAFYPIAALLGGLAFTLVDRSSHVARPARWPILIAATLMLTGGLSIYQPAAMFFWVFAAVRWMNGDVGPRGRCLIHAAAVMAIALAFDYAIAKLLTWLYLPEWANTSRTALAHDIPAKLYWFVTEPLLNTLNLPFIEPGRWIAGGMALMAASGVWMPRPGPLLGRSCRVLLAIALVPLSYLPSLIVAESWASYRAEVALASLLLVYATMGSVAWSRVLNLEHWLPAIMSVTVALCACSAAYNVVVWFVLPQTVEYRMIARVLQTVQPGVKELDFFLPTRWTLTDLVRYDEFGTLSCSADGIAPAMAWLILHSRGSSLANVPMRSLPHGSAVRAPEVQGIDLDEAIFGD